jgi:nucleoside phosphorylase
MKGGAKAQVCWHYKVSCLVVRSITDGGPIATTSIEVRA